MGDGSRVLTIAGCVLALLLAPAWAGAAPGSGPTAIVSLGDSFISGEAGRWQGNSVSVVGDRDGTDRAWRRGDVFRPSGKDDVYPGTDADGCHRADVAPVHAERALGAPFAASVNLACSGADTADVTSAAQKGHPPQVQQLAATAASHDVRMIVLSIGGNDLGFADIIVNCFVAWAAAGTGVLPVSCHPTEQPKVDAAMPAAMAGVGASIDAIRATMAAAGYAPSDYRLVLQSYPSPVPRADDLRWLIADRLLLGSCPMTNADADWARGRLVEQIADNLAAVAADRGVELLDLRALFDGREACSKHARQAFLGHPPSSATSEWVRFIDVEGLRGGETQESFHPNAYGQRAMGACWAALAASAPGRFACTNVPGAEAERVTLVRTGDVAAAGWSGSPAGPAAPSAPAPASGAPVPGSSVPAGPAPVAPPRASTTGDAARGGSKAEAARQAKRARARAKRTLARRLARCGRVERAGKRKACRRAARRAV